MTWTVVMHPEVQKWLLGLDEKSTDQVLSALEVLAEHGPNLGRPMADTLTGCTLKNLKELRPGSTGRSEIRILFAFGPVRQAMLLAAGDKSKEWKRWYQKAIPLAEQRFAEHVRSVKGGRMTEMIPWEDVRAQLIASGKVTEESIAQAKMELDAYIAGYRLAELRHKTGMTQVQVAEAMGVSQARISAMERGDVDSLTIASVRGYVTALGGTVRIVASLEDTDVTLRLPNDSHATSASGTPHDSEGSHTSRDQHHSAA